MKRTRDFSSARPEKMPHLQYSMMLEAAPGVRILGARKRRRHHRQCAVSARAPSNHMAGEAASALLAEASAGIEG